MSSHVPAGDRGMLDDILMACFDEIRHDLRHYISDNEKFLKSSYEYIKICPEYEKPFIARIMANLSVCDHAARWGYFIMKHEKWGYYHVVKENQPEDCIGDSYNQSDELRAKIYAKYGHRNPEYLLDPDW